MNDLESILAEAEERVASAADPSGLDEIETACLGRKGSITLQLRGLGALPPEERPAAGARINAAKQRLQTMIDGRRADLGRDACRRRLEAERIDVTLPGRGIPPGRLHPMTRIADEIRSIFVGLGFEFVESPDVESVANNFTALNYPPDHPAYDEQMSFYLWKDVLLRTQTTAYQGRYFPSRRPPMKLATMGRVFRYEQADPTHGHAFHQIDGILIDRGVCLGDLFGTLDTIMKTIYGPSVRTRFRPHYFPFTEPSAEMDLSCIFCSGEGCRICKGEGWLEMLGSGMIHPNCLRAVGIDTEEFSGFAFGMGLDRIPMLKYGVPDLRLFLDSDLRFLEQF